MKTKHSHFIKQPSHRTQGNTILIFCWLMPFMAFAQSTRLDSLNADAVLWGKLDSILVEAQLMANYEASAWISTDLLRADSLHKDLAARIGGYVVYNVWDSVVTVYYNQNMDTAIFKGAGLVGRMDKMVTSWPMRPLSPLELELAQIRKKVLEIIEIDSFGIAATDLYTYNLVLLPELETYSAHLLPADVAMGYTPYGEDFHFRLDKEGNILYWKKEHSSYLGVPVYFKDYRVQEHSHRHGGKTPLPSSSDICQFLSYRQVHQLEAFSVYSLEYHCYIIYQAESNSFKISLL